MGLLCTLPVPAPAAPWLVCPLLPQEARNPAPGILPVLPWVRLPVGPQPWSTCSAQLRSAPLPTTDMVKDVVREYDEHFPEIIERATYTLEKVGAGLAAPWYSRVPALPCPFWALVQCCTPYRPTMALAPGGLPYPVRSRVALARLLHFLPVLQPWERLPWALWQHGPPRDRPYTRPVFLYSCSVGCTLAPAALEKP